MARPPPWQSGAQAILSRDLQQQLREELQAPPAVTVSPRDPLLDYKRPRLVQLLHEARAQRDEAKKQAQTVQASIEQ
jgi:hypothetical protein